MIKTIHTIHLMVLFILSLPTHSMNLETVQQTTQNQKGKPFEFDTIAATDDDHLARKAYGMAPQRIHDLVHALKTNLSPEAHMGPLLFTGPPGTGKTTLARSLAIILNKPLNKILTLEGYKKSKIKEKCKTFAQCTDTINYKYVNASEFGNQYQHSKQHELKELIHAIEKTKERCVLIIDEVHALFSGQENENSSQAQETALALKHIFERLEESKKILLIFTTNYPDQIPKEYGLRSWFLQGNVFHFAQPNRKQQMLALSHHLEKITTLKLKLPHKKLKKISRKLDGWSFRRIAALCDKAALYTFITHDKKKKPILGIIQLKNALHDLKKEYKLLEIDQQKPSEQERFCNENLALQRKLHNRQLTLSKKTMKFNGDLQDLQAVMQLRALNVARYNSSQCTMTASQSGGYKVNDLQCYDYKDRRKYGDSKKALPKKLQSRVGNKKD